MNPYSTWASSRIARCVRIVSSLPGCGSLSNDDSGMRTSYPTPFTSMITWVGTASTNFPRKKVIIVLGVQSHVRVRQESNPPRGRRGKSARLLCMGKRECQCVRRVWSRRLRQPQHPLDHFRARHFLGSSVSYDRLLHFARRHFENLQPSLSSGHETNASRLAHKQRRLQVLREEQALDDAHRWMMQPNGLAKLLQDAHEAARTLPTGRALDRPLHQNLGRGPGQPKDSV